ncbi:hypothetical protein GMDG_03087 [Pseudogymnoascus destructans 20631-21]|uniref:Amine oxidase n=1 Tax=Pseudogymnoascus destructans (strain ATCC MYA-4855 / 20631-21) TaxID=658429 RepID=L8G616_PSED2|nr:hypothetical protein GMDG_03087 [Pseudogymnoascus destructans 20631-21]
MDPGSSSRWGTVVSPRVLAQNHQHMMCVRVDPAIDGHQNYMQVEEAVLLPLDDEVNTYGNAWAVRKRHVEKSGFEDADPLRNRTFKIVNEGKINGISGNPVGYKVVAPPPQTASHPSIVRGGEEGQVCSAPPLGLQVPRWRSLGWREMDYEFV